MEITILLVIGWLLIGFCGCVYWWTRDNDFAIGDVGLAFLVSVSGPFSFIVGWTIHGKRSTTRPNKIIIIKKKEKL